MRTATPPARTATLLAAALSLAALLAGVRWGALVAGGSDSYGYVSQAGLWQRGGLVVHEEVIEGSPWPLAAATWTPLGYRPSPKRPDAIVPVYSPGLPLLMALLQAIGGYCGAFFVVPLSGALTIWLTYVLGRRVFDAPGIALWGAALVATSPVFLYQLMNAMSDVPVTAAWTLALVLVVMARPIAGGLAMSVAVAIRPNLLPLAAIPAVWIALREGPSARGAALRSAFAFSLGVMPAVAGIAWLNDRLYESAWTSGYGSTGDLYGLTFFPTNVRQFASWMSEVQTPVVALAGLYFVAPRLFPDARIPCPRLLLGGTLAGVALSYLFYRPYDVWWYLRFLLPMWPVMMLLTAAALDAIARRWARPVYRFAVAGSAVFLAWHGMHVAITRHAFDLGRAERRYVDVARFIATTTDRNAVMFSVQHSGSLRIYADRLTLKYDVLDPAWLDRTVEYLQSIGRRPYFVLDGGEVDAFRQRFAASSRLGALDWPPLATFEPAVSVFDPGDRRPGSRPIAFPRTAGPRGDWLCDPPQSWPPLLRIK